MNTILHLICEKFIYIILYIYVYVCMYHIWTETMVYPLCSMEIVWPHHPLFLLSQDIYLGALFSSIHSFNHSLWLAGLTDLELIMLYIRKVSTWEKSHTLIASLSKITRIDEIQRFRCMKGGLQYNTHFKPRRRRIPHRHSSIGSLSRLNHYLGWKADRKTEG